ncbi:MAG TPA: dienelactone hydrolase family protein [Acidimicrobiia bacterium]|nr:dienelactone hydrolase family protein [Acidimicrobiia bacterium]
MQTDAISTPATLLGPEARLEDYLAPLPHEGKYPILYGSVAVPVGSDYRSGYLARPDAAGQFPVVLVIPGLHGLDGFEKNLARRLARWGLAGLVVDIWDGDPEPLSAYQSKGDKEILIDLDEAFEYLQSDEVAWAIREPIGVLGLDLGGRFALIAAAYRAWVGPCAVVSAPLTGDEDRDYQVADILSSLSGSVLGLYGADDDLISAESVDVAQDRNSQGLWLLYDGAGHWFHDDDHPEYHAGAGEDAFVRLRDLFLQNLPAAIEEDLG